MVFFELMHQFIDYLFTQDPLMGSPPRKETIHNGKITYIKDNEELHSELFEVNTYHETSLDDIINFDLEIFCSSIFLSCEDSLEQAMKGYFKELGKVCDFAGNSLDARGREFSHDMFLDALEKLDIPFDENDNPILPKLVVNPILKEKIDNLEMTGRQKEREKKIIEKKREEHLAKKCYRKLSKISFRA